MENKFFDNYISTHFGYNTNISSKHRKLEYRTYELNTGLNTAPKDSYILEIGFGTGIFLEYLESLGFKNVEGIEVSRECLDYTKKLVKYPLYIEKNLDSFAKKNLNKYDHIILFDVLEHIKKDEVVNFLQSIKSMLKNSGMLHIRVPNSANPFNQIYWNDITHEFFYNSISLNQVLKLANFNTILTTGWLEEDILFKSKLTNLTSILLIPILRLFLGLLRTGQFLSIPFSRNLYAKASKS